jgi:glucose/arabinose dehydrogenase
VFLASACLPPKYLIVSTVIAGQTKPWDIAFTPDGTLLFTEKVGRINAVVGGTKQVMATVTDVQTAGEGGMLGLAVDPDFATNRAIYTCFNSNIGGSADVRVVRWTVNADYTALSNRTDIVTGLPVNTAGQAGRHSGCRPRFGPDGNLWIGTGDAATPTVPQDPTSLGGKVLRVDRDGHGVAGNPGVDDPDSPLRDEIYTYGHRNVQGIAFRPSDSQAYSVEHGTGCDDELNRLVAGANYGWNPVNPNGDPGYYEGVPMTDLVEFPDAVPAVWSSGCPTIAPSGATFLEGTQWKDWNGDIVLAVLKGTELRALILDQAGTSVTKEYIRIEDQGRLRVPVQGPNGDLFVAQDSTTGSILQVHPTEDDPAPPAG